MIKCKKTELTEKKNCNSLPIPQAYKASQRPAAN